MKNKQLLKKWTVIALLGFFSSLVFSQSQQHVWQFKNQEIDFSSGTPQVNSTSGSLGGYQHSDGIHDENGNSILRVEESSVVNKYNQWIGDLPGYNNQDEGSIQIVPFSDNQCKYYILYSTISPFYPFPSSLYYSIVDLSLNNGNGEMVSTGNVLNSGFTNIKYEDFAISPLNINNERFLYNVGLNQYGTNQNIQLTKFIVNDNGINYVSTVNLYMGVTPHFHIGETELSHDGSMLAYSGVLPSGGNNSSINIVHLDPLTGDVDYNSGNNGVTAYQLTDPIVGIEFTPNSERIYYSHFGLPNGITFIDLNTSLRTYIVGSSGFNQTDLELIYDPLFNYKIGCVNTGNQFGFIESIESANPIINVTADQIDIGEGVVFVKKNLPKQIDGEDYINRFNDPINDPKCCLFLEGIDIIKHDVSSSQTWSPINNPFNNQAELIVIEVLRIKSGSNVTFNDMLIKFEEDAKLVIEPNARLTINNTTLTSADCENLMWLGVELQGDASLSQTFTNQGVFIIQSNSEISNAINAINIFGSTSNGSIDWSSTGGLVRATNSTFRNNKRDVQFLAYNFKNNSFFRNCEFITDAPLNNGSAPLGHVSMYKVDGIGFYGNDFKNITNGLYPKEARGYGIKSIDAKYKVNYRCNAILPIGSPCNDKDPNIFEGLVYGIEATATNSFYTVEIMYNEFIDNRSAIYLGGVDYAKVVNNEFEMDDPAGYTGPGFFPWTYGLYLENSTGYQVENNNFYNDNSGFVFGAIVNNSNNNGLDADINEVYNNYFEGLVYGGATINENVRIVDGDAVTNTGLTFKCNDFVNTSVVDLFFGGPIASFQGACLTPDGSLPHSPANNTFSPVIPSGAHLWNANSVDFQMDYRYSLSSTFQTEPLVINITNTTKSGCANLQDYDSDISCPEKRFDLPNKVILDLSREFINSAILKENLIDGGIKDELLLDILSMSPGELKNKLLLYAPYLSDEVLIAVLERTPALPVGIIKEIMFANAPLSSFVISAMEDQYIPNGIANQIQSQMGISPVRDLQAEISYLYREASLGVNEVIRRYIHDTSYVNGIDSVKVLLEEQGLVNRSKCKLVSMHIKNGDLQQADSILTELEQNPSLSEFCEFQRQIIDLDQQIQKCFVMVDDSARREIIEEIADRQDGSKECLAANRLLEFVFTFMYDEEIPDILINKSLFTSVEDKNRSYDDYINVFPNPATDILHIEAGLTGNEKANVILYSISGKIVKSATITQQKSYIDLDDIGNGSYFIRILMPENEIRHSKVLVK